MSQSTVLRDTLAGLYYDKTSIRSVAKAIDLPSFRMDARLIEIWETIVSIATENEKIDELVAFALKDYPDNDVLKNVLIELPESIGAPSFVDHDKEKEVEWRAKENAQTLEKIAGKKNNILPVSFLEEGLQKSKSVARVKLQSGGTGTGFLTNNNLLITNHHVIPDEQTAMAAEIEFNFQQDLNGAYLESQEFECDPTRGFQTCPRNDWTIVRLSGVPNERWGAIKLESSECRVHDRVIIIQHPAGGPKSIGLYHNLVTSVTDSRIQYLTDTMPGSSGSPVFNNDWELVALHHTGGWVREPGTKTRLFRNQGIAISVVCAGAHSLLDRA